MKFIEHIVEPSRLLLSWQSPVGDRRRYIVAELRRTEDDADLVYLRGSGDYQKASERDFRGYHGFPLEQDHTKVLPVFMRRLPPRHRTDFDNFMEGIRIHPGTSISDFALLGYAGGKLPSDDFVIIHPFDEAKPPFEFLLMVAGYRYYKDKVPFTSLRLDMTALFELEPDNPSDPDAVRVVIPPISQHTAGYVYRGLLPQFRRWINDGLRVDATVERLNGTAENPLVYLYVAVRDS